VRTGEDAKRVHSGLAIFLSSLRARSAPAPLLLGLSGAELEIEEQPHGHQHQGEDEQTDLQPPRDSLDPSDGHAYHHTGDDQHHPDSVERFVLGPFRGVLLGAGNARCRKLAATPPGVKRATTRGRVSPGPSGRSPLAHQDPPAILACGQTSPRPVGRSPGRPVPRSACRLEPPVSGG